MGIAAAIRLVVPGHAPSGPGDDGRVRLLGKRLPRRARRALEEPARALAASAAPLDLEAWRAAAAATADRAGLVLCGDVGSALAVLLREGGPRAPEPPAAGAPARPEVLALLAFAATEEHFVLRQRLRVAIA
jgi:hypothetical protein